MDWSTAVKGVFEFILPFLERLPVVRAILGLLLVFFLPGLAWTLVLFRHIGLIERMVFAVGLSIAIVTLSVLFLNLVFGLRVTGANAVLVIILVTILPVAIYYLNRLIQRRKKKTAD